MVRNSLIFELTDGEIRRLSFDLPPYRKFGHKETEVKVGRIPIPTGIIEQGIVRKEQNLIEILSKYPPPRKGSYHKVCLAIPLQQGFIGTYTIPWLSKGDRKSAIALFVAEEIAIPKSDLIYDFLVIDEVKHQSLRVLLGAARRSLLEKYVFIFAQAGFRVTEINFSYAVLGQALGLKGGEDVLYLQEETETIQIVLFRGTVPESVRSLPAHHEQLEAEIRRFLLFQRTQQQKLNLKRIVWSGNSRVEQLAWELSDSNHQITIEKAVLNNRSDSWQRARQEIQTFGMTAMGYGQQISANHPRLNLWRQPSSEQIARRTYRKLILLAFGVLLCLNLIWLFWGQKLLPLQEEVKILSRQGTFIEEQNKNQEALFTAWSKANHPSDSVGEKLIQVNALSGSELQIEQVIFKQGCLSVHSSALDSQSVQKLLLALRTMGWKKPALSSYQLDTGNKIQFILNATME